MEKMNKRQKLDDVLNLIVVKKLITPITKTDAFKKGLVDKDGKTIKTETEDGDELSLFDKLMFKIKRLLGPRKNQLNNFLYVQTLDDDVLNNIVITGGIEKKGATKRVKADIEKLFEKYDVCIEDVMLLMIHEQLKELDKGEI
jgi:hypothetical protein